MKLLSKKSGFSLVELIVGILFINIVLVLSFNMVIMSIEAHELTVDEYELQSAMRIASDSTNNVVRYSSAIFTVADGRFFESNLTDGWSYFGVSEDRSEIVEYIYEERTVGGVPTFDHYKNVLVAAQDGITYDITFEVNSEDDSLIKYTIVGTSSNNNVDKIVIESEIEAVNALQVVERGTSAKPAIAIAYRSDDRPENDIVGVVTMVLDTSGSMGRKIDGTSTSTTSEKRITKLKNALNGYTKSDGTVVTGMISEFAKEEFIEIAIVPFAITANYPSTGSPSSTGSHPFYKVSNSTEEASLKAAVSGLGADGGTNTGDGMRRAYYRSAYFRNNITSMTDYGAGYETKEYMIILVDGITTFASSEGGTGDDKYELDDGYQSNLTKYNAPFWHDGNYYSNYNWTPAGIIGEGGSLDPATDRYVELVGDKIKNDNIKVYVIGFSSKSNELDSVEDIATAAGADVDLTGDGADDDVYPFTDNLDLDKVFAEIKADIMLDLWHVRGPAY